MDREKLGTRLKYARDELRNMSLQDVANLSGVARSTVQRYETGKIQNIKLPVVESFARALHVNPLWLIGKSDNMISDYNEELAGIHNILPVSKTKKIPLFGTIACNTPIGATQNIESYIDVDNDIHADFALLCKGDSMINARIMDGDIVYIHKQNTVESSEIAAVLIEDGTDSEAILKRVYISPDKIRLCAENPAIDDIVFFESDMKKVKIIGKAVAFLSVIK